MGNTPPKTPAYDLALQALQKQQAPAHKEVVQTPAAVDTAYGIETLLDMYEATETPQERDFVFEKIVQHPSEKTADLLYGMSQNDTDPVIRDQALHAAAQKRHPEALHTLQQRLKGGHEWEDILQALDTLASVYQKEYTPLLKQLWENKEAYTELRIEALLLLEAYDIEEALTQAVSYVAHFSEEDLYHLQELETAVLLLLRHKQRIPHDVFDKSAVMLEGLFVKDNASAQEALDVVCMGKHMLKRGL